MRIELLGALGVLACACLGSCILIEDFSYSSEPTGSAGGAAGATGTAGTAGAGASHGGGHGGAAGGGGSAGAAPTLCGEEVVDLMTDENHCGACDHPCPPEPGSCTSGMCDPLLLFQERGLQSVAFENGSVFVAWLNSTGGYGIDEIGSTTIYQRTTSIDEIVGGAGRIALVSLESNEVGSVSIAAGTFHKNVTDSDKPFALGFSPGTAHNPPTPALYFHRNPTGGGFPPRVTELLSITAADLCASCSPQGHQLAAGDDIHDVYWTAGVGASGGTVIWQPTNETQYVVASDVPAPSGIALDATHVYWLTAQGAVARHLRGDILSPLDGLSGATEEIVAGDDGPVDRKGMLAVNDSYVYWLFDNKVTRAEKNTGEGQLVLYQGASRVMKLHDGWVYVINESSIDNNLLYRLR